MKTSREIPGDRTNLMKAGFSTDITGSFYNFFLLLVRNPYLKQMDKLKSSISDICLSTTGLALTSQEMKKGHLGCYTGIYPSV